MSRDLYLRVVAHLELRLPPNSVRSYLQLGPGIPVPPSATFFDYVVVAQRRYWASSRSSNCADSMAIIKSSNSSYQVGELVSILAFHCPLPQLPVVRLGYVRLLLRATDACPQDSAWNSTYVLLI
jgi:hypothetical protein